MSLCGTIAPIYAVAGRASEGLGGSAGAAYIGGIHLAALLLFGFVVLLHRRERKASRAAERAGRIRSEFLALVSHELRTPMNGVAGMADVLLESSLTPRQRECILAMRESVRLLLAILGDILDCAKIQSGALALESAPFSPAEMMSRVHLAFLGAANEKDLELKLKTARLPEYVLGDVVRVRQAVGHLVGNAIKFTDAGSVSLAAEAVGEGGGAHLIFSVTDTGIGIDPEARERIFENFMQVDATSTRRFSGLGLGLGMARSLVVLMGGSIHVESELGRGSRFWFWLPLRPAASSADPPTEAPASAQGRLPVLVADDNPVNQKVAMALLQSLGTPVVLAKDGFEAVAKCSAATYAAILMDCHMPGMDGYEATRRIRALKRKREPIIALTAGTEETERRAASNAGMDDFLSKPVQRNALQQMLNKWSHYEPRPLGGGPVH